MHGEAGDIDLGGGFAYRFFQWAPNRRLNPQYAGLPDIERAGIILIKDDIPIGVCTFDLPETRAIPRPIEGTPFWQLLELDPLHIEPSIQTHPFTYADTAVPGYHGWIRGGRWVEA